MDADLTEQAHYTRDYVWLVFTDNSFAPPYKALHDLGITGLYFSAAAAGFYANCVLARAQGFKAGVFYPAHPQYMYGADVANSINAMRLKWFPQDSGQTPILLDFEPEEGSVPFWTDFIPAYRTKMPGRVTDFTPAPFKATVLPVRQLLNAKFDVKVQGYFGDMSAVDFWEAGDDWVNGLDDGQGRVGFPREQVRMVVDGGRHNRPPIFYLGYKVRNLSKGSIIWNANLLREAGLI